MRDGILRRLRSRALPLVLAAAALAAGLVGPIPIAQAKLDPLNIITVQIQRADIMVVLDTSGSMAFRPEDNQVVGGDCYNGANCVTTALPNTCTDGTTCAASNTCLDGYSGCTSGVNSYCANGDRCLPGRLCGSGSSQTVCPSTTTACRDGSACGHLCTDGTSVCNTDTDCPTTYNTCGTTRHCQGNDSSSSTCTTDSNCTSATCNTGANPNRCEYNSGCGSGSDCFGASSCSSGNCRWYNATECTANSDCRKCVATCSNNRNTVCTNPGSPDSACGTVANTCNLSTTACAASTGSTTCGYWCSDGTACATSSSFCTSVTGAVTACTLVCPDSGSCYTSSHCGTGSCPSGSNIYLGSSRLAIAKHSITNVMAETKNIANFGFMTFNQTGYFPYQATSSTTRKYVEYLDDRYLRNHGGWDTTNARPLAQFSAGGRTYTIECAGTGASYSPSPCTAVGTTVYGGGGGSSALPAGNSQYQRNHHHGGGGNLRTDFCGTRCTSGGRSWNYQGSYYTYDQRVVSSTTITFSSTYQGPSYTSGSTTYTYFQFPYDYNGYDVSGTGMCTDANGDAPVCALYSGSSCSDASGSRTDGVLRTMPSLSDTQSVQDTNVGLINNWLALQNSGGVVARSGTPTGCSLQFASSGSTSPATAGAYYDAYSAMSALKTSDPAAACRNNAVLLVTDGEPNGPGDDSTCGELATCGTDTLSGCTCKSVLAARHMKDDLGVKTYAVGFGAQTTGSSTLDNIAKAGGSPLRTDGHYAFYAIRETDLVESLRAAVYAAAKGDYTTAAPTVATSSSSIVAGDYALLASSEFPSFRGHLRAFRTVDASGVAINPPTLAWDAGTKLATRTWNTRKVFTSNSTNNLVGFVDGSSAANSAALYALGLGASATEAASIIEWTLGNGRAWPLGALLNSTPMTHGTGIDLNLPGHAAYQTASSTNRPKMVYVGADDGMLHAFYMESGTWGNAGDEAWAYVPPDLLPQLTEIYVNGGQSSDPTANSYGVNSSPKINDVCTGSCAAQSDWRTVLVSGEGPGGKGYFALDISALPSAAAPFSVLWHSAWLSTFADTLGQSWSVPAFAFAGSPRTSILLFGSGYDVDPADGHDQGAYLHLINTVTGAAYLSAPHLAAPSSPVTTYAVIADTAVAMDPSSFAPVAAYQADLGGRVWRLAGANTAPGSTPLLDSGVAHPYYYSPSVYLSTGTTVYVALNDSTTDDPDMNTSSSAVPYATLFKDDGGTKVNLTLNANSTSYTNSVPLTSLCKTGCTAGTCACSSAANRFTSTARPASSPVLINNLDALATASIQAMFLVYQPPTAPCAQGRSYVVVLDVTDVPVTQSYVIDAGAGKAAGMFVGGGGQLIVAKSGTGSGAASLSVMTSVVAQPATGSTTPVARVVGQVEKDD